LHQSEGYIKFSLEMHDAAPPSEAATAAVNEVRTRLWRTGLIGIYPDGIGFGNVSVRAPSSALDSLIDTGPSCFYISGTQTGAEEVLSPGEYALVYSYDRANNFLRCSGRIRASSESLSHGACYEANPEIQGVIHVHSRRLFDYLATRMFPSTSQKAANGTPEIADEINHLVRQIGEPAGIFYMGGHDEGVIAYGPTIEVAETVLLELYRMSNQ